MSLQQLQSAFPAEVNIQIVKGLIGKSKDVHFDFFDIFPQFDPLLPYLHKRIGNKSTNSSSMLVENLGNIKKISFTLYCYLISNFSYQFFVAFVPINQDSSLKIGVIQECFTVSIFDQLDLFVSMPNSDLSSTRMFPTDELQNFHNFLLLRRDYHKILENEQFISDNLKRKVKFSSILSAKGQKEVNFVIQIAAAIAIRSTIDEFLDTFMRSFHDPHAFLSNTRIEGISLTFNHLSDLLMIFYRQFFA